MRIFACTAGCAIMCGCAVPQYQTYFRPFDGANLSVPAGQAEAICRSEARGIYAETSSAGQAQLDARNNRVTGYNCATTGQANAYGNTAYYSGNTNCAPVTANPYRGKYGGLAALGDALAIQGQAFDAQAAALSGCMARYGYSVQRRCIANCAGGGYATSGDSAPGPGAGLGLSNEELCAWARGYPNAEAGRTASKALKERGAACDVGSVTQTVTSNLEADRKLSNSTLCYRATYQTDQGARAAAQTVLSERGVSCK